MRNTIPLRRAILIGCPGEDKNYLSGVKFDLDNFSRFLQSPKGGLWYQNEIITLNNPSLFEIEKVLSYPSEYTFIYFSGHGYTNSLTRERMLCIKDCNISDRILFNNSSKQLIIADTCRNFDRGISGLPDYGPRITSFEGSKARQLLDYCIINSYPGKLIVHSTQEGYSSIDISSIGGVFTSKFLTIASDYRSNNGYIPVSIDRVIADTSAELELQKPTMPYNEGYFTIPFSIAVPIDQQKTRFQEAQNHRLNSPNNSPNWLALGGLALILWGLSK